jgi:hypothetical protein
MIPEIHKEEVQKQTEQMLRDGIIAPSTGPWNSPILVVRKKVDASGKKKWRIMVDFRKLNVTIGDSFPIPVISEVLNALGNSRYVSTIDCASGFLQVPAKVDQPKTAFSTAQGHIEHKKNAVWIERCSFNVPKINEVRTLRNSSNKMPSILR